MRKNTNLRHKVVTAAVVGVMSCTAVMLHATPEETDNIRMRDQHNMPVAIPQNAQYLLYVGDMEGKNLISQTFADAEQDVLGDNDAYVVANLSDEPTELVHRYTLPKLKELPYQVLLDTTGAQTDSWTHEPGAVRLLRLNGHQVTSVETIASPEALLQAVTGATAAGAPDVETTESATTKD